MFPFWEEKLPHGLTHVSVPGLDESQTTLETSYKAYIRPGIILNRPGEELMLLFLKV